MMINLGGRGLQCVAAAGIRQAGSTVGEQRVDVRFRGCVLVDVVDNLERRVGHFISPDTGFSRRLFEMDRRCEIVAACCGRRFHDGKLVDRFNRVCDVDWLLDRRRDWLVDRLRVRHRHGRFGRWFDLRFDRGDLRFGCGDLRLGRRF